MARGGADDLPYEMRRTTLDLRKNTDDRIQLRQTAEEEKRQRQKLANQQRRQRDEALAVLTKQRDQILQSSKEQTTDSSGVGRDAIGTPAYVRTGGIDLPGSQSPASTLPRPSITKTPPPRQINTRDEPEDTGGRTLEELDDRIRSLNLHRNLTPEHQGYSVVDEFNESELHSFDQQISRLEDHVFSRGGHTPNPDAGKDTQAADLHRLNDLLEKKEERLKQHEEMLKRREQNMEEELDKRSLQLQQHQDYLKRKEQQFEEDFRQRNSQLRAQEDKFIQLQKQMEAKFQDMERRLEVKEERLIEHERKLDERSEVKEERLIGHERKLDERDRHDRPSNASRLQEIDKKIAEIKKKNKESELEEDNTREVKPKETKTAGNLDIKLNISFFSGALPIAKSEVTFEDLKREVENVKFLYSDNVIRENLRRSLKGQAKRKMLHLGPSATVDEVMVELEDSFGMISTSDTLLSKLLLSAQDQNESVIDWSLRLEDLMLTLSRKTKMDDDEKQEMLRKRFWRGLWDEELKQATRNNYESSISYEHLRKKVREEEFEIQLQKERSTCGSKLRTGKVNQAHVNSEGHTSIDHIMKKIEQMDKKIDSMSPNQQQQDTYNPNPHTHNGYNTRGRGYSRGYGGRYRRGSSSTRRNPQDRTPLSRPTQEEGKKDDRNNKKPLNQ